MTFDTSVHFYSLRPSLAAPQMLVVPDITDLFMPVPEVRGACLPCGGGAEGVGADGSVLFWHLNWICGEVLA